MRFAGVILAGLFLTSGSAWANGARLAREDVPLRARASAAATTSQDAPIRFNLVGLHWRGPGSVFFRTRALTGGWSRWHEAAPEREDLPDADAAESRRAAGWRIGNPYWTGPANAIEYRVARTVSRLRAHFVWSPPNALPMRTISLAGAPAIVPRLSWGANERIRRGRVTYARALRFAVVHHTAGSNSYSRAESAAIVRGIQVYHVQGNGWDDIGYNFLVDRYGQVFEGRYGGTTRNVVGAHAQGFNTGSVGVALLGTYGSTSPTADAVSALARLLAWRLDLAHVDPLSLVTWRSSGNPRFPAGAPVVLRTVSGHRDTGFTDCPGAALYRRLPEIARRVFGTGLPKLFNPSAQGAVGGPIRFRARLTAGIPWTVTVRDRAGATVGAGAGSGQTVSWLWDSAGVPGDRYAWAIEARGVRAARGTIGSRPSIPPALLADVSISPRTVTPNDDGRGDFAIVRYTLGAPALVTATFTDAAGVRVATLFSESRPARRQSFRFVASAIPDGRYRIVLAIQTSDGRAATAAVDVLVSRLLREFTVTPPAFSPNGDGKLDRVRFGFELAGAARARVEVRRSGRVAAAPLDRDLPAGRHAITWGDRLPDGRYQAVLTVTDARATVSLAVPLAVDTRAPRLALVSLRPLRVRVSEPATLVATLDGRAIVRRVERGVVSLPPARSGQLVARDAAGNRSRALRLD